MKTRINGEEKDFKDLLRMTQGEIHEAAMNLSGAFELNEGTVFVPGTIPLVLVAHMDTVYDGIPEKIVDDKGNLSTPKGTGVGIGGDDRCGIWCLFTAANWEFKPSLMFCSDEETCNGSSVGLDTAYDWSDYKCFIEVDGPGYGVYYAGSTSNSYLNDFMEEEIGLTKQTTSYNDIAELCTEGNPPGITLGGAYYNQHMSNKEWISSFGLNIVIETIRQIVLRLHKLEYSVVPKPSKTKYASSYYGGTYGGSYTGTSYGSGYNRGGSGYTAGKKADEVTDLAKKGEEAFSIDGENGVKYWFDINGGYIGQTESDPWMQDDESQTEEEEEYYNDWIRNYLEASGQFYEDCHISEECTDCPYCDQCADECGVWREWVKTELDMEEGDEDAQPERLPVQPT